MSQKKLILVVDDYASNTIILSDFLKSNGFETITASNGAMALQQAYKCKPDLILLNVNMPGMNGYEVCERLKADEQTQDIPIIFISASGDKVDKIKAFAVGGLTYIIQPFIKEELLTYVKTLLMLRQLQ